MTEKINFPKLVKPVSRQVHRFSLVVPALALSTSVRGMYIARSLFTSPLLVKFFYCKTGGYVLANIPAASK